MNDSQSISAAKRAMRVLARESMRATTDADRAMSSLAACNRIIDLVVFQDAATVMLYLPLPGEMDCTMLIEHSLRAGKTVCVPLADWESCELRPVRLRSLSLDTLSADRHGVRVPIAIEPVAIELIDSVIVPGLAFDETGGRLGRGGGFYDRFLAQLPASIPTIGLAFERQILRQIPREPHDARVGQIATETRLIRCG